MTSLDSITFTPRKRSIPDWIKTSIPGGARYTTLKTAVRDGNLHTVCTEARCPNIGECFNAGHAAFLVMGDHCTRNCLYCAVTHGNPSPLDPDEPGKIADAIAQLSLRYTVITSVTRDDLGDGGASHFSKIVSSIRNKAPECFVELLIPDFLHSELSALDTVTSSSPDCVNHNIEIVEPLFQKLRPQGDYLHSLRIIRRISDSLIPSKSGLMIGFGESDDDIRRTLNDLRQSGCRSVTIGQYLRSQKDGFPVIKFYHPDEFRALEAYAQSLGFDTVLCTPLARSSYHPAVF
ncbi:MAG TPA: lipoyl synthase [Spirochaetota bacterium]